MVRKGEKRKCDNTSIKGTMYCLCHDTNVEVEGIYIVDEDVWMYEFNK